MRKARPICSCKRAARQTQRHPPSEVMLMVDCVGGLRFGVLMLSEEGARFWLSGALPGAELGGPVQL